MAKKKFRWLALKLAGIITLVFVLQKIFPSVTGNFLLYSPDVAARPWILVTSIFLHANFVHLAYNMFALALFGLILEKRIGSRLFVIVFFTGGILANLVAMNFYQSSLGASGAIFVVIGMLAVLRPWMIVWVSYIPMPMWLAAIAWMLGDIILTLAPSDIGTIAHLSGIMFGFLAGFAWKKYRKTRRQAKRQGSG
jgi:membrane associated rhomboid family serine protease